MSKVFVLNTDRTPLDPVHPGRARILLRQGKAAVLRHQPFALIMKQPSLHPSVEPLRLKIDPGSKTTGIALVNDATGHVVWAANLEHRAHLVARRMEKRRVVRHGRRSRKTRHRPARFLHRVRPKGWITPSMTSRVSNILTWVSRLRRLAPVGALSLENAKFDTQLLQNPEIKGVEYQQGTLQGYEIREYLLEKWQHRCAYCPKPIRKEGDEITTLPRVQLQVEHIVPRSKGGSDRVSNLCVACKSCNECKGTRTAAEFGHPEVQAQAKISLRDATQVTSMRKTLYSSLRNQGLPLEVGSGGRTKLNRTQQGLPKEHWIDAACVGASTPAVLLLSQACPLAIKAMGWGSRQVCQANKYGFPKTKPRGGKTLAGFATGDVVRAVMPTGKHAGAYRGRLTITCRAKNVVTVEGQRLHVRFCTMVQRNDGYSYP